jgi:spore coat protein U-like protein
MNKILLASVISGLASLTGLALAAPNPATATFEVRLAVQKACSVTAGSASDLDFGTQDPNATNLSVNKTISVTCSKNTAYTIGLLPSNNATTGAGSMAGATAGNTDTVAYQLRSATGAAGAVWGDATTNRVAGNGDGTLKTHTVYGTVANVGNVAPDNYKDVVTVNVRY